MNAGRDYDKAKAQAKANANRDGRPRTLHMYAGVWWITHFDSLSYVADDHQIIEPDDDKYKPKPEPQP